MSHKPSVYTDFIPKGVHRHKTSIYVDREVWARFLAAVRKQGLSTCAVLEAFMIGYVQALEKARISPLPNVNLNLTVVRDVKRIHRYSREVGESKGYVVSGSPEKCALCDAKPSYQVFLGQPNKVDSILYLCPNHFENYKQDPSLRGYRRLT